MSEREKFPLKGLNKDEVNDYFQNQDPGSMDPPIARATGAIAGLSRMVHRSLNRTGMEVEITGLMHFKIIYQLKKQISEYQ